MDKFVTNLPSTATKRASTDVCDDSSESSSDLESTKPLRKCLRFLITQLDQVQATALEALLAKAECGLARITSYHPKWKTKYSWMEYCAAATPNTSQPLPRSSQPRPCLPNYSQQLPHLSNLLPCLVNFSLLLLHLPNSSQPLPRSSQPLPRLPNSSLLLPHLPNSSQPLPCSSQPLPHSSQPLSCSSQPLLRPATVLTATAARFKLHSATATFSHSPGSSPRATRFQLLSAAAPSRADITTLLV